MPKNMLALMPKLDEEMMQWAEFAYRNMTCKNSSWVAVAMSDRQLYVDRFDYTKNWQWQQHNSNDPRLRLVKLIEDSA